MPEIGIIFYQEADGTVPTLDWIKTLPEKAQAKCMVRIERLRARGHELRRPDADYLRDDIYELRVGLQGINYRILYFFHGRQVAVVSHGLQKERRVPPKEIDRAIERKTLFERNPDKHTYSS